MDKKRNKKIKSKERSKQVRQAKDKCSSNKVMVFVQRDCSEAIQKCLFYLRATELGGEQLADWTFVGKSKSGSLLEIRPESFTPPMLSLQYQPRRSRSEILQENVHHRGSRVYGKSNKRQTSKRKSLSSLRKTNRALQQRIDELEDEIYYERKNE
jgi:hypothetical protein